jgi:predicted neuraminidase
VELHRSLSLALSAILLLAVACAAPAADEPALAKTGGKAALTGIVQSEFIFEHAPFAQCHASTIEETPAGLVAAWFGGTEEGEPDVGIWLSRRVNNVWTPPVEVAAGADKRGQPSPCWNPVLFQPKTGPLLLFYKVGPSPSRWWGMMATSTDNGATWSPPQRLPGDILGPIKNKPVQLPDGSILCPSSVESGGWRVYLSRTRDMGKTWDRVGPLESDDRIAAIQPTILRYAPGEMQLICRSRQEQLVTAWSNDEGKTWSRLKTMALPNPDSGIDAVMLRDGRALLVSNPTTSGRHKLSVALSADGLIWRTALVLEDQPGEYSYPAVIQTADGLVHIAYTWKRERIKHVVLDPQKLVWQSKR